MQDTDASDPTNLTAFADPAAPSVPLHLVEKSALAGWLAGLSPETSAWVEANGFQARAGDLVLFPGPQGAIAGAAFGLGDAAARSRTRFAIARAAAALPPGNWRLATSLPQAEAEEAALGWLLASYRFTRYRAGADRAPARLVAPDGIDARRITILAQSEALIRDLINTPPADLGPQELEETVTAVATEFGATVTVITGDDLLARNFPMIHAVGRASPRAPRLIDLSWGTTGPRLTLVGKGVCFDTGGLDLKPSTGMLLMKKDMGGAATALGLARSIMALNLPLRLRLLIPAVENSVAGNAMRPKDILTSRKGLTVEVNNTDAEGRLVLADALALACEDKPDLLVDMGTLTGAARVALGPELPPFYTDDEALAGDVARHAMAENDPIWRLPLWPRYEAMLDSKTADTNNVASGGMAGSIVCALFLKKFVDVKSWLHFDVYAWTPAARPGRPEGGECQAARAMYALLCEKYGSRRNSR